VYPINGIFLLLGVYPINGIFHIRILCYD
jgi:hypothetical protein